MLSRTLAGVCSIGLLSALFLITGPSAAAPYPGLNFTPVVVDDSEAALPFGFLDIREVAFAEPKDGHLVLRVMTRGVDGPPAPTKAQFILKFSVDGVAVPGTQILETPGPAPRLGTTLYKDCQVDGNFVYCKIECAPLKIRAGSVLSGIYAFTQLLASLEFKMDFAPGGLYYVETANGAAGPRGSDYVVEGCDAGGSAPTTPVVWTNLTGPSATGAVETSQAASQIHRYNWTSAVPRALLNASVVRHEGTAHLNVTDGAGKVLWQLSFTQDSTSSIPAQDPGAGSWRIEIGLESFRGRIEFNISEAPPPATGGGQSGQGSTNQTQSTGDANSTAGADDGGTKAVSVDSGSAPGPGVLMILLGLVAGLVMAHRRRQGGRA
jgi:hypothetical protein